jgi:hypothetical protein
MERHHDLVRGQPLRADGAVVAIARWDGAFGSSERKMAKPRPLGTLGLKGNPHGSNRNQNRDLPFNSQPCWENVGL